MKNLFRVTEEMAACNQFDVKPIEKWPRLDPEFDISQLERQAASITDKEELLMFVDGETQDVQAITEKHKAFELNRFLNEVFDGYLHEVIAVRQYY